MVAKSVIQRMTWWESLNSAGNALLYLAMRLKPHGSCVNVIRPGFLDTASARATFGETVFEQIQALHSDMLLNPHKVAKTCVALCSGYMDAVTGQVITVDEGWGLVSPLELLKLELP
ncbi:MAG: SDR family oxidoreductase [Caldilineaceae bacterium]